MRRDEDAGPARCSRCGGAGYVSSATAADFIAEDSYPRERPVVICEDCGGTGYVVDEEEDSEE